jgi:hypothetical protein
MMHTFTTGARRMAGRTGLLGLTAAALLWGASPAAAQQAGVPLESRMLNDLTGQFESIQGTKRGFSLFAEEDLAGTSLRLTGSYRYTPINAGGLCAFAGTSGDIFNTSCGQFAGSNTYFHVVPAWGVGINSYRKIREVHPGVATMLPPVGYSTPFRISSIAPIILRIGAADGQFGQLFAGVTSAIGEGCREFTGAAGGGLPSNFTLTASLDCPPTWAGGGYDGIRRVPDQVIKARFDANPNAFQWEDWRYPRSEYNTFPHLGNNSTYGAFSDYYREALVSYGGVSPKGSGPPTSRGFPLGIKIHYDAWKFDSPSLRNGAFVRWLIINRSEDVWGRGIDYDDLVVGVDPGYIFGGQAPGVQNIIKWGVHSAHGGSWSGQCSASYPRRVTNVSGACAARLAEHRFIMILKSPLGDLRNKQLSDPASPFYAPNSPFADDTITFNQWRRGGFNNAHTASYRRSDRALYGWLAGDEELFLDGRQVTEFTASQIMLWFRYESNFDGAITAENARWNRFVPGATAGYGSWDFNNDGIQDTIKVPDCGVQGCAEAWSDTSAGGINNANAGNIGNFLGFGPFQLKAGDTTEVIWYLGGVSTPAIADTIAAKRQWEAILKTYYGNYSGASAAPLPTITPDNITVNSAFLRDSTAGAQNVEVRIQLKFPPRQDDPFLKEFLERLEGPDGAAVRANNPGIVEVVRGRMRVNTAEVLIYKSCDNGVSWTHLADCTSAVAASVTRDEAGQPVGGIGWRYRARITFDSTTGLPSGTVFSEAVQGGRTYLYSLVSKTRSLADIRVRVGVPRTNGMDSTITLQDAMGVDIDTIISPLVTSGRTTALVYAPISVPAGTRFATLDTIRVRSRTLSPTRTPVTQAVRSPEISGTYRLRFGNRWIVTRTLDTVSSAQTTQLIRQSVYLRATTQPGGPVQTNFVASADTFVSNTNLTNGSFAQNPTAAQLPVQFRTTPTSRSGTLQIFVDTIFRAGYVLAQSTGGSAPLYVSFSNNGLTNASTGAISSFRVDSFTQATARFEADPQFPGFAVTLSNTVHARTPTFDGGGVRSRPLLRAPGDTADAGIAQGFGVTFTPTLSLMYQPGGFVPGGQYRVQWAGDSFGPRVPFRLSTPGALNAEVAASLAARPVAQTTSTDETVRTLTNFPGGAAGTRPLVAAKLPFQVYDREDRPTAVVMFQRHTAGNAADSVFRNSRLFGNLGDTVRVTIPPDVWMPGDTLYMIEDMIQDSTVLDGTNRVVVVRDTTVNGRVERLPIQVRRRTLTQQVVISCASSGNPVRFTCNPLATGTLGATGYFPFQAGWSGIWRLNENFDQNDEMSLVANALLGSARPLTNADMENIYVVPNPYIVQGGFDRLSSGRAVLDPRIMFVNVPKEGLLRVYSVSGQLMQQLSWTQNDLIAQGSGTPTGDLPFILRTREGLDFGPGLYLYVLTAKGENANGKVARGKFVIIR